MGFPWAPFRFPLGSLGLSLDASWRSWALWVASSSVCAAGWAPTRQQRTAPRGGKRPTVSLSLEFVQGWVHKVVARDWGEHTLPTPTGQTPPHRSTNQVTAFSNVGRQARLRGGWGLGPSWGALGVLLGRSWALLGRPWTSLGRPWALLGRSWAVFGRCWREKWSSR